MAILYGTQSNGETLPVLVDQFGNLLAKGIEGPPGPEGPEGPEGPPGPSGGGGDGKIPTIEPIDPSNGDVWLDTTDCPAIFKAWTECPAPGEWMEYECIPLLLITNPTLIGSAQVAQILSVTKGSVEGGVPPYSYEYQFFDQLNQLLQSGSSNEYVIKNDDLGKTISATYSVTDSRGTQKTSNSSNAIGPVEIAPWTATINYLVIGGGGSAAPAIGQGLMGGGAGGYLSSMAGEKSGGNSAPLQPFTVNDQTAINLYSISVGKADEDTSFSGGGIERIALAGGSDSVGASGSGQKVKVPNSYWSGTAGQGCDGGTPPFDYPSRFCEKDENACDQDCRNFGLPSGGGGSNQPGDAQNGGDGTPSLITGTQIFYAGGGGALANCANPGTLGTSGKGQASPGGGGEPNNPAQGGVVILSMPSFLSFEPTLGNLVVGRSVIGDKSVVQISSGSGEGRFVVDPLRLQQYLETKSENLAS